MSKLFSKLFTKNKERTPEKEMTVDKNKEFSFKWHDIGPENPMNKRVLDCRSLTLTIIAVTTDEQIARKFNELRVSNGRELIEESIHNCSIRECELIYPHNGRQLEGIVFKAESMDAKWDVYIYDSIFYFSRSWTGDLIYKAYAEISKDQIRIYKIEYSSDPFFEKQPELVENNVHFLMKTHAMKNLFPHMIPNSFTDQDTKEIALYSFGQFGNRGCFATKDSILDTEITLKNS